MNPSAIYILFAISIFAIIALILFFLKKDRKEKRLSRLAGVSFAFIIAGIFFGENRLAGYGLIGVGVILAIIDMIQKLGQNSKSKRNAK
jgi:hypothetical protein